ncbi:MAG: hypothetical protein ACRCUT_10835 [Spirochaetota bacterium]
MLTYTRMQFKKVATFFYILTGLFLFNLYFNLNYSWFGVSLIVRVYLYLFSFFLIYSFSINNRSLVDSLRVQYINRYGPKGEHILQFENKIIPFVILFVILFFYTMIDYIPEANWPWTPILKLIGGRYSNVVIYSLILYFILNTRRSPGYSIGIFLIISIVYFFGDRIFYQLFPMGPGTSVYRVFKFTMFFFILLYDFSENTREFLRTTVLSVSFALVMYAGVAGLYLAMYYISDKSYYIHRESTLVLAKFGYPVGLRDMKKKMIVQKDVSVLGSLFRYGRYYDRVPDMSDNEWSVLLFSGNIEKADSVARYMLEMKRTAPYELLIGYIDERIAAKEKISEADYLVSLASQSIGGHEPEFTKKIKSSGREFTIWGIQVVGQTGSAGSVPFLLPYLFDIDERVSREAYRSLCLATKLDPAKEGKVRENSPEVLLAFKTFYLENRIPLK